MIGNHTRNFSACSSVGASIAVGTGTPRGSALINCWV
ncbi:Uncharacterised protein [Vibrio cholerae]|nr:Uncharacterised protein [Vibrio cholerae]